MENNKKYLYSFGSLERASVEVHRLFHVDEPVSGILKRLEALTGYATRLKEMGNDGMVPLAQDAALLQDVHELMMTRARSLLPVEAALEKIHPSLKELMASRLGVWKCDVEGDYNV